MTPTDNQKHLIKYYILKLQEVERMDVSSYTREIQNYGDKIDAELAEWGIQNDHSAGDAIRDLVMNVIANP